MPKAIRERTPGWHNIVTLRARIMELERLLESDRTHLRALLSVSEKKVRDLGLELGRQKRRADLAEAALKSLGEKWPSRSPPTA